MSSIFPDLVSDASNLIVSFCDASSQIQLSGVNKEAYKTLSNGAFFREQYSDRHPHLKPFNGLFKVLRSHHPSNCWKVVCQILDRDWVQKGFNLPSLNYRFAEKVSPAFIQEAIPITLAAYNANKTAWQADIRDICGAYYADPNSLIDKAWKEYQESKRVYQQVKEDVLELKETLTEIHSEEETDQIFEELKFNYNDYLNLSEERFADISVVERKGMDPAHFSLYRKIAEICSQTNELWSEVGIKSGTYNLLESRRRVCEDNIARIDQTIVDFLKFPESSHMWKVAMEWDIGLGVEQAFENRPHLENCCALINQLIAHPEEKKPAALENIRRAINACTDEYRIGIWRGLYVQCANEVIEDSWAENHFPDFLPQLQIIVGDQLRYAQVSKIDYAERNLKY